MKSGIYLDVQRSQYDRDDFGDVPTLNSTTARVLIGESPLHAWHQHPRLNPAWTYDDEWKEAQEIGSAVHATLLGDGWRIVKVMECADWKKPANRAERDEWRAKGHIVLRAQDAEECKRIVAAARQQLAQHEASVDFADGAPEATLIWEEFFPDKRLGEAANAVRCRARIDWLPHEKRDPLTVIDLKTTAGSAHPDIWARRLYDGDGDMQAAFYARGLRAVLGVDRVRFLFVVIEQQPPYALSVCALEPASLAMAERKVEAAIAMWRTCMHADRWPGYPQRICHVQAPAYAERAWLEREERDAPSRAMMDAAREFQRP